MPRPDTRQLRPDALPVAERLLLGTLFLAAIVLLSFPAARGIGSTLGWTPFWLLALPAASLVTARLLAWRRRDVGPIGVMAIPASRRRSTMAAARRRANPRRDAARLLAALVLR